MGFLIQLLTFPILGPIQGVVWISEQIAEQVDQEFYNEDKVRGQLLELELRYDLDEISEEEYMAAEEVLLARLKVIANRRHATE